MSRSAGLARLLVLVLLACCSRPAREAEPAEPPRVREPAAIAAPPRASAPDAAPPEPEPPPPPTRREQCLTPPIVPDIRLVPRLAGLERGSCGGNPREQLLYRSGSKRPSLADLEQLGTQLTPALSEQLGVEGVWARTCCDGQKQKQELCLFVRLPLCAHPLERVAQVFADALSTNSVSDTKVGLFIEYTGYAGPRCNPADASCKPVPYATSPGDKAAGRLTPPYDPALGRERVNDWKEPLSSGSCAHDGDCALFGCGNHCMAWHTPTFAASCPAFDRLADAHCGCVTGQCAWFTQVPEAHFRLTPDTPMVSSPGLSPERLQKTVSLGWLTRQFRKCYEKHLERLPLDVVLRFQVDGAGRLHSVQLDTPDTARAACLTRAVKQLTASRSELPPNARQEVSWRLTLHLAKPEP